MSKCMSGIDVSFWQGAIDFSKVKADGIDFVILKAGGSDDGLYTDSCFERNYKNAKENGLHIGCYYFVNRDFDNIETGIRYAEHFAKIIKGKSFDMPVCLDIETTSPKQKYGATSASIAFCNYMEKLGYYVSIYSSSSHFDSLLDTSRLKSFDKWVAQWSESKPNSPNPYGMWQYTDKGTVDGVNCFVDRDIAYYDYPSIIKNNTTKNETSDKNENTNKVESGTNTNYVHNEFKEKYNVLANEVIRGDWGNGNTRRKKLNAKGYDYQYVQDLVNVKFAKVSTSNVHKNYKIFYTQLAKQIISGKYGNGNTRKKKILSAGYDYNYAQKLVNQML